MCLRLLSQPWCIAAWVRGAGFGAGAGWDGGLRGSRGKLGAQGQLFINQPFPSEDFRVHLPPAPAGKRPHCLSTRWAGAGHSPAQWGGLCARPAGVRQQDAQEQQLLPVPARQPHGMGCQAESEAGGGSGRALSTLLLTPQLLCHGSPEERGGGTPLPCAPCHPAFPACCGVTERHAPFCQGREEKPAWGPSITPCACLRPQAVKSSSWLCLQGLELPQDSSLGATARKHNERLAPGRWRGQPQLWGSPSRTRGLWTIPLEGFGEGSLLP